MNSRGEWGLGPAFFGEEVMGGGQQLKKTNWGGKKVNNGCERGFGQQAESRLVEIGFRRHSLRRKYRRPTLTAKFLGTKCWTRQWPGEQSQTRQGRGGGNNGRRNVSLNQRGRLRIEAGIENQEGVFFWRLNKNSHIKGKVWNNRETKGETNNIYRLKRGMKKHRGGGKGFCK